MEPILKHFRKFFLALVRQGADAVWERPLREVIES